MVTSEREDKERMLGLAHNELLALKGVCDNDHVPRIEELEADNR